MSPFLSRFSSRRNTAEHITPPIINPKPEPRSEYLDLRASEVANRILLVGDHDCAKLLRLCLDEYGHNSSIHTSEYGITTIAGTIKQKPVNIISIGNGMTVMDVAVRELRDLTKGPLAIIHLAKCSTHKADVALGTAVVARDSFVLQTSLESETKIFRKSQPIPADPVLQNIVANQLARANKVQATITASDITTDTFYAAQGRNTSHLNYELFADLAHNHPTAVTLQMQTYPLYHLAQESNESAPIKAAACAIVINNLAHDIFLENQKKHEIELYVGQACLQALAEFQMDNTT